MLIGNKTFVKSTYDPTKLQFSIITNNYGCDEELLIEGKKRVGVYSYIDIYSNDNAFSNCIDLDAAQFLADKLNHMIKELRK